MIGPEVERLVQLLARLPGLGPRSGRRAVLHLLKRREALMTPLAEALQAAADAVKACSVCGTLDVVDPCAVCADPERDGAVICVVADVGDLWAIERSGAFRGRYHVLGGTLSAIDGRGPDQLNLSGLKRRASAEAVQEVVLALNATVDGQTTAHYVADLMEDCGVEITRLAHGLPVGGELDYLDDGTLTAALKARRGL